MSTSLVVDGIGPVQVSFTEHGSGKHVLLLHGGGGPGSVSRWGDMLATSRGAHVVVPTHPGIADTPRPDTLTDVRGLARVYAALIDKLGLKRVAVVGHSIGGWIAAELGLVAADRISSLVLIDAVGIEDLGHPAEDVFAGEARTPSDRALKMYAGNMMDPTLRPRLAAASLPPTLVLWGDDDDVVDRDYGRTYAREIAGAQFTALRGIGHSPQLQAPRPVADAVWAFVTTHS
jgi:pimeloyl-ACP methyl ester carboxylesterase